MNHRLISHMTVASIFLHIINAYNEVYGEQYCLQMVLLPCHLINNHTTHAEQHEWHLMAIFKKRSYFLDIPCQKPPVTFSSYHSKLFCFIYETFCKFLILHYKILKNFQQIKTQLFQLTVISKLCIKYS